VGGRGVDVERKHLGAQDPAVRAVGQLDAEPVVVGRAPDRGQHIAQVGPVDDAVGEPWARTHRCLLGDDAHQRLIFGARGRRDQHHQQEGGGGDFHG
jgi:hypothetical protein